MPTPGPPVLVLHCQPGETPNLLARTGRAPQRYIGRRRTSPPTWRGRVGSPGEGQSRPIQPPPRQLQGVTEDLPSCNNNWNVTTIGMEQQLEGNSTNPQQADQLLPDLYIQFLSSSYQFIASFSTSVIPYPKKFSLFFPGRPCCDKAQQNGRKNEREKGR